MMGERQNGPWLGWKVPRPAPRQILWRLLPSPFARALGYTDTDAVIPKPHVTSWLNGLRGVAALIVVNMHVTESSYNFIHEPYGLGEDGKRHLIQLPIVRLLCAGHFMVAVFFVISGYALSHGPLELAHSGRAGEAASLLASGTFRRAPRLFLPVLPVLAASAVPQRLGAWYPRASSRAPEPAPASAWRQLVAADRELVHVVHGYGGQAPVSLPQAWTLSVECTGSFVVFAACLALRRASCRARVACVLLLVAWLAHADEWAKCMFLCGMAIADTSIARRRRAEEAAGGAAPLLPSHDGEKAPSPPASRDGGHDGPKRIPGRAPAATSRLETAGWYAVLLLSLLLGGWPAGGNVDAVAPYSWAARLLGGPDPMTSRLALGAASVLLVAALDRLPAARRPLDSRAALYLGEISYGLYLCHILVARTSLSFGLRLELERRWGGGLAAWAAVLFGVALPGAVWLGDLHWRLVDKKCVRFTRWLAERVGV
ncbi:hypothetical protein RB595_005408 [Gaeumannomyces hyphopodioides]